MGLPSEKDIQIYLLLEAFNMGGEARPEDHPRLYKTIASHFPQITPEDLRTTQPSTGANKFENRVTWARLHLIKKGELDASAPRGFKRITNKGRERLMREGLLGRQAKPLAAPTLLAKKGKEERPPLTHEEMVQKVKEMGEMLGKVVEPVSGVPYRHDCVWRDNPYANPKLVWEVCDKGNLDKDIASLIWAVKSWNAKGILVLFEESDFHTAQKKLAQESQIYPLKADDMLNLHSLLEAGNAQAIKSILAV